jgi:hypothetical protein
MPLRLTIGPPQGNGESLNPSRTFTGRNNPQHGTHHGKYKGPAGEGAIAGFPCHGTVIGIVRRPRLCPTLLHPTNATTAIINRICFMPATLRLTGSGVNAVGGGFYIGLIMAIRGEELKYAIILGENTSFRA